MSSRSFEALKAFFENAPVARRATRPLAEEAEVGLALEEGPARFTMQSGAARVLAEPAVDPDFTLTLPEAAVRHIAAVVGDDVGELGIEFFKLVLSKDPASKVRVRIHAPTARLFGRGYFGVLALGGMKVTWWLLRKGVRTPRAAIERLRSRG